MSEIFDCYYCQNKTKGQKFDSWDKTTFYLCNKCKCASAKKTKDNFIYEENYWHQITDPDGKKRNLLNEKKFKIDNWYGGIIEYVNNNFNNGSKILDIGCGLGHLISSFNKKFEKYALDVSKYSIEYINKEYPEINSKCSIFKKELYENNFFDVVIAYHVIEHIDNPFVFLEDIKKILKKNGVLIIGTPNRSCLTEKLFKGNFRLYSKEHILIFNKKEFVKLLKSQGFEINFIEYPFFKTQYFNFKNLLRLFLFNKVSPPFFGNIMTAYAKKI